MTRRHSPDGLWDACEMMESGVRPRISRQLAAFRAPLRDCYEAGVQVPTVPSQRAPVADLQLAAVFLKRSLTDLRTVWVLLERGYTSGAAAVAAALWEHAAVVGSVAGHPERASRVLENASSDLPWKPKTLAKLLASRPRSEVPQGVESGDPDFERGWRQIYGGYKFLCKIKHPTMRHSIPALQNTAASDGEFVVMAAPDTRPEDLPLKATVLMIATTRCFEAIDCFATASGLDVQSSEYASFDERMERVPPALKKAYEKAIQGGLPFHIGDEKIGREYGRLRRTQQLSEEPPSPAEGE